MYQLLYKNKLKLNFGYTSDKGYAGATIVDKDNNDAIIKMGDTHHLQPTQIDMQKAMQAQQIQYLQNQNKMLASAAGSVYGDNVSVYIHNSALNHYNNQTMVSLTQQNLQNLHNQNMSAPFFNMTSPSQ
eukprot:60645_1